MYPKRKQIRLLHYDYALSGAYYVTFCSYEKKCIFSSIVEGKVHLTALGKIIDEEWNAIQEVRPSVMIDEYVIMPNHVHAIIILTDGIGTHEVSDSEKPIRTFGGKTVESLSTIMSQTRSKITKRAKAELGWHADLWQRGFYDHIIRDDNDMRRIRDYIMTNALNWEIDHEHP
jgi:putative transposase